MNFLELESIIKESVKHLNIGKIKKEKIKLHHITDKEIFITIDCDTRTLEIKGVREGVDKLKESEVKDIEKKMDMSESVNEFFKS